MVVEPAGATGLPVAAGLPEAAPPVAAGLPEAAPPVAAGLPVVTAATGRLRLEPAVPVTSAAVVAGLEVTELAGMAELAAPGATLGLAVVAVIVEEPVGLLVGAIVVAAPQPTNPNRSKPVNKGATRALTACLGFEVILNFGENLGSFLLDIFRFPFENQNNLWSIFKPPRLYRNIER
jgi:hypothetical protein